MIYRWRQFRLARSGTEMEMDGVACMELPPLCFQRTFFIWSLGVYRTSKNNLFTSRIFPVKILLSVQAHQFVLTLKQNPTIVWHCHCSLKKETATMQQNKIEVFCPSCNSKITPQFGIHKTGQRTSLEFQSRRLGCSIECTCCGTLFIHKIYPDDKKNA